MRALVAMTAMFVVCSDGAPAVVVPKNGAFVLITTESVALYQQLSEAARLSLNKLRQRRNSLIRSGNFGGFDFQTELSRRSVEAAQFYDLFLTAIDVHIERMDEEAQDFINQLKNSFINGPESAFERLSRVEQLPKAYSSLSNKAKRDLAVFPNLIELCGETRASKHVNLVMRQIYMNVKG